ncbi:HAMP domain-containing protein, partial [bacterium]|nr:HAMP domain-containing protein [bacterium]
MKELVESRKSKLQTGVDKLKIYSDPGFQLEKIFSRFEKQGKIPLKTQRRKLLPLLKKVPISPNLCWLFDRDGKRQKIEGSSTTDRIKISEFLFKKAKDYLALNLESDSERENSFKSIFGEVINLKRLFRDSGAKKILFQNEAALFFTLKDPIDKRELWLLYLESPLKKWALQNGLKMIRAEGFGSSLRPVADLKAFRIAQGMIERKIPGTIIGNQFCRIFTSNDFQKIQSGFLFFRFLVFILSVICSFFSFILTSSKSLFFVRLNFATLLLFLMGGGTSIFCFGALSKLYQDERNEVLWNVKRSEMNHQIEELWEGFNQFLLDHDLDFRKTRLTMSEPDEIKNNLEKWFSIQKKIIGGFYGDVHGNCFISSLQTPSFEKSFCGEMIRVALNDNVPRGIDEIPKLPNFRDSFKKEDLLDSISLQEGHSISLGLMSLHASYFFIKTFRNEKREIEGCMVLWSSALTLVERYIRLIKMKRRGFSNNPNSIKVNLLGFDDYELLQYRELEGFDDFFSRSVVKARNQRGVFAVNHKVGSQEYFSLVSHKGGVPIITAVSIDKAATIRESAWIVDVLSETSGNALLILLFVVAVFILQTQRPLKEIIEAFNDVGAGNLERSLQIETGDELEELGNAFNRMVIGTRERLNISRFIPKSLDSAAREGKVQKAGRQEA